MLIDNSTMFKSETRPLISDWLISSNFSDNESESVDKINSNNLFAYDDKSVVYSDTISDSFLPNLNSDLEFENDIFSSFNNKFSNILDNLGKGSFNITSNAIDQKETASNETSSNLRSFY